MKRIFTPRDYQKRIIEFILDNPRCNIFAGMGLGKSASTLAALDVAYMASKYSGKTLIIAPLRVAQSTWPDEVDKWDFHSIKIRAIVGSKQERIAAINDKDANVFTTNYENIPWLVDYFGDSWPFEHIVADESTRLKSFRLSGGSKRARALSKVAFRFAKTWVNLTGTPAPNGLIDLWGQNWFVDRGERLGRTFSDFVGRWFKTISFGGNFSKIEPYAYANDQIQKRLADICLTLDASDWLDIREPVHITLPAILPKAAMANYKALEKEMFTELASGEEVEVFNAAAKTIKCLQVANGNLILDDEWVQVHKAKLEVLESVINEASGAPIIVAYHFKNDLKALQKAFPKGRVLDKNPETIREWNRGEISLLFAHPQSAGHGLSLQDGGNILVFFSHWWSFENHAQIIERIGPTRQLQAGYNRPVYVYEIVAKGTIDELVVQNKKDKKSVQNALTDALKAGTVY